VLSGGATSVDLSGPCRKGNLTDDPTGDPDGRPFAEATRPIAFSAAHQQLSLVKSRH
jgi:hypothetical protein